MMRSWLVRSRLWKVWVPGGTLLLLGGCGLSDQQLTQIVQTVITTALTTFVANLLSGGAAT